MPIGSTRVLAVAFGLAAAAVAWFYFRRGHSLKMAKFADREEKVLRDIYAESFKGSGLTEPSFESTWRELSGMLEISAGKLRPTDRFDVELAPAKGYEFTDQIREVRYLIDKHCSRTGAAVESIKTVRDYVEAFGAR